MTDINNSLLQMLLKDHRKDRRWRNVRFFGWMFILLLFAFLVFAPSSVQTVKYNQQPYAAFVRLEGIILPETNFCAERVIPQLEAAFSDKNAKGVVLLINSPGGSPVQSSILHDKILALKQEYHQKVIVVGEDALASGAYLIATAADKIYVSPDTLTGSIGVAMNGFGFVDTLTKLGMTRRMLTAGQHKSRLDPFEPLNPADVAKAKTVLDSVHQNFINNVITGRGSRLHGNRDELFSGDFWTGTQAKELGLVDGTDNLWEVLKKEFNVTQYEDYTEKTSMFQSLLRGLGSQLHWHILSNSTPLREQAY